MCKELFLAGKNLLFLVAMLMVMFIKTVKLKLLVQEKQNLFLQVKMEQKSVKQLWI